MLKKYTNVVVGAAVMLVSVILFISTFSIKALLATTVGPEVMPKIASTILFLAGLGIMVEGYLASRKAVTAEGPEDEEIRKAKKAGIINMFLSIALIAVYIYFMPSIGFLLTTIVYVFLQELILSPVDKRKPVMFLIIAVITGCFIYFGFVYGLELILPSGILG